MISAIHTEPFTRLLKPTWKSSILIVFLLFSGPLFSQEKVFSIGAVAGLNTTQISGDNLAGFNKIGLYAGLYTNININENLQFQIETCFSQKGSRKIAHPEKGDTYSYRLNINYVDIPVFARFRNRNFVGEIGPCISYFLNHTEEDNWGTIIYYNRPFSRFELSGFIGMGYHVIPDRVVFSVRINNSLLPVRDHLFGSQFRLNRGQYNAVLNFVFQAALFRKK